jgi:hypothetical protein
MAEASHIPLTSRHRVQADGVQVFYREAGPANAPVILLLHRSRPAWVRLCRSPERARLCLHLQRAGTNDCRFHKFCRFWPRFN